MGLLLEYRGTLAVRNRRPTSRAVSWRRTWTCCANLLSRTDRKLQSIFTFTSITWYTQNYFV